MGLPKPKRIHFPAPNTVTLVESITADEGKLSLSAAAPPWSPPSTGPRRGELPGRAKLGPVRWDSGRRVGTLTCC